jgi:enamine deaminase RidA (YjgF/YER057c/UK114 family)
MKNVADCSVSVIQQPPLDGSKIATWLYLQKGTDVENINDTIVVSHNGYRHLWNMGMVINEGDSATQTTCLLQHYENTLQSFGATLADHCIRTWFFVRDVDTQYAGMVKARKEFFTGKGLTEQTHYISSTGIGGLPADTKALVQLGAYALTGFEPQQQRYLYAPTHLNPTYEYGVTFERGTIMEYGDRSHVFISGTASINNKGEVVYIGDVVQQTKRMWENVSTLLEEAGTTFDDVAQIIVYLRDISDYEIIQELFRQKFPTIPTVFTLAPVCRPTWLIEMECIAIKEQNNEEFRDF